MTEDRTGLPTAAIDRIHAVYRKVGPTADLVGAVLADAQDTTSPLHDLFEWDDTEAAHQWRLAQARHLIGRVKVRVVEGDGEEFTVRAYVASRKLPSTEPTAVGAYTALGDVMGHPDREAALLGSIERDVARLRRKYRHVSHLLDQALGDARRA